MKDTIYRADAIEAIQNTYCKPCKERGDDHNEVVCRACNFDDAMVQIDALPSAEATCATCADRAMCIMSAPDGNWKACKDYRPSAEAVQGEWIFRTDIPIGGGRESAGYVCSNCRKDYFHVDGMNFCPNCGAKMTKGGDE